MRNSPRIRDASRSTGPRVRPKRKTMLLIDPATSGCAGCYVDRIFKSFRKREHLEVAVSRYYPFSYGKRIFYKYSDLAVQDQYPLGRARLYVRFGELVVALARLLAYLGVEGVQ